MDAIALISASPLEPGQPQTLLLELGQPQTLLLEPGQLQTLLPKLEQP